MKLTDGTCTLDGNYAMNWTLNCYEAAIGNTNLCPLALPADFVASVSYGLKSENFCATTTVDVGIVGNLRAYQDNSYTTLRTAYIVNRLGYFLVKVNSDLNTPKNASGFPDPDLYVVGGTGTVITFSKVTLVTVTVRTTTGDTTPVRLYENSAPEVFAAGSDLLTNCVQITQYLNGTVLPQNQVGFSFNFTRKLASQLVKNSNLSFIISAEVQVTYSNLSKKRFGLEAFADGTDSNNYESQNDVQDDGTGPTDTATVTDSGSASSSTSTSSSTNSSSGSNSTGSNSTGSSSTVSTSSTQGSSTGTSNSVALVASFLLVLIALMF